MRKNVNKMKNFFFSCNETSSLVAQAQWVFIFFLDIFKLTSEVSSPDRSRAHERKWWRCNRRNQETEPTYIRREGWRREWKKKVRNYRRHWDVISSILLLCSFSLFSLRHRRRRRAHTQERRQDSGQQQHEWAVNVNGEPCVYPQPSNSSLSEPRVCFFTPNSLLSHVCSSSINEWLLKLSSSNH